MQKIGLEFFIEKINEIIFYMETRAVHKNMKLDKFRSLGQHDTDYKRIIDII